MNLTIEDVHVAYGRSEVLHGVSLEVPDRTLVCLMGRNGEGKTTLLNAATGLLPVQRGRVLLDGEDITKMAPHARARAGVGYVPQGHQVFPQMTVRENLQVVMERDRKADRSAYDDALDLFPAVATRLSRPAGLLSGGQAQQLSIARALVTRPQLLLLDEPTEGIQPSVIKDIGRAITFLRQRGDMAILLVEQYVEFALRLAERYAVMEGGLIAHAGETATASPESFAALLAV